MWIIPTCGWNLDKVNIVYWFDQSFHKTDCQRQNIQSETGHPAGCESMRRITIV